MKGLAVRPTGYTPCVSPSFNVLRFLSSLKAARDLGLDARAADEIALRFDPRTGDREHVVDALTAALLEPGVLEVPDCA